MTFKLILINESVARTCLARHSAQCFLLQARKQMGCMPYPHESQKKLWWNDRIETNQTLT